MSARLRPRAVRPTLVLAAALCTTAVPIRAQAPPPRAPAPAARAASSDPRPDASFEAARTAFEALPETARRAVQDALVWTGAFAGTVTGTFGRRTFDAIVAFQRASGAAPSGMLDDRARAALLAAGAKARQAAGFALRRDAATGIALGVPTTLLPRENKVATGTRWQSPDGRLTLETRAYAASDGDLAALYERLAAPSPQRAITYKLKRPDFFVVSGETTGGRFYIRVAVTPDGLRGVTISTDKAVPDVDRVIIAISNSFDPAPGPVPAVAAAASVPGAMPAPVSARGTGLAVAPGKTLTTAGALAGCTAPRIDGLSARVGASNDGLVLLDADVAGGKAPAAPSIGRETTAGTALLVLAMDGGRATLVPGEAGAAGTLVAPLQPGAAGAPVFDRTGALVGLVAAAPRPAATIAGVATVARVAMTDGAALQRFLERAGLPAAGAATGAASSGAIAAAHAPDLRALTCE